MVQISPTSILQLKKREAHVKSLIMACDLLPHVLELPVFAQKFNLPYFFTQTHPLIFQIFSIGLETRLALANCGFEIL
jgi:hypothetical protein